MCGDYIHRSGTLCKVKTQRDKERKKKISCDTERKTINGVQQVLRQVAGALISDSASGTESP